MVGTDAISVYTYETVIRIEMRLKWQDGQLILGIGHESDL